MIICKNCLEKYVCSANSFKSRFRIHESNIKTNKDRCGTANNFNNIFKNNNIFWFLSVEIIEQIYSNAKDIEEILWRMEKLVKSVIYHDSLHEQFG